MVAKIKEERDGTFTVRRRFLWLWWPPVFSRAGRHDLTGAIDYGASVPARFKSHADAYHALKIHYVITGFNNGKWLTL